MHKPKDVKYITQQKALYRLKEEIEKGAKAVSQSESSSAVTFETNDLLSLSDDEFDDVPLAGESC